MNRILQENVVRTLATGLPEPACDHEAEAYRMLQENPSDDEHMVEAERILAKKAQEFTEVEKTPLCWTFSKTCCPVSSTIVPFLGTLISVAKVNLNTRFFKSSEPTVSRK